MLTEEHIKEGLSKAFVSAIATKAGMNCAVREYDYGMDGTFIDVKIAKDGKRRIESGFKIDFQLKSTINIEIKEDKIVYPLDAKNYRDLIDEEVGTPRILILFYLPRDSDKWLKTTEEKLTLRHCAWWHSLKGEAYKTNSSTVTINIPRNQLFTVEALQRLMSIVRDGGIL